MKTSKLWLKILLTTLFFSPLMIFASCGGNKNNSCSGGKCKMVEKLK